MKSPVIHIKNEGALADFIHFIYENGGRMHGANGYNKTLLFDYLKKTYFNPKIASDGFDCYLMQNYTFYTIEHPTGIRHYNLTHVNSLAHMKQYAKKFCYTPAKKKDLI